MFTKLSVVLALVVGMGMTATAAPEIPSASVDQVLNSKAETSIQRHRRHHPHHGWNIGAPVYLPSFPGYPIYPHPGYPAFPIWPTPGYNPVYGMFVCTAHNNYGYYWQGVGYNQWQASQNALAYCYQYSGYCQVTACGWR